MPIYPSEILKDSQNDASQLGGESPIRANELSGQGMSCPR